MEIPYSPILIFGTLWISPGPLCAVSPPDVCAEEFVLATELACKNLPQADGIQLRAKVASVLTSSKPPKQNVTKEERQAIKDLQKADDIIILPADKGKSTVILDKNEYEEKVNNMLADKKTYEELPDDPTPKYKRKLVSILTSLKKEGKISEAKYKELYPTAENVPRLYCTPKIHKPGTPLRPIVDYTSTTGLLPGHLFSSGETAGGRSKISSALNRLALEIPLDLYCVVYTNIIEHT